MKRLTIKTKDGYERQSIRTKNQQLIDKLAEYEDLEKQSRLIKLPCKVGDDVYYILGIPNETPCVIDKCTFELSDINKIGKTLFLTKPEAEAKLKELRGGGEMNEVRFRFHLAVTKFYLSIMNLLSEKCNEHNIKAEKILKELERYGA